MSKSTEDVFNLNYLILPVNPTPPTPPEGNVCLYIGPDGRLHLKDSAGLIKTVTILDNSTWLCVRAHRSDNFNVPAEPSYYWKMFAKGGRIGFTGERGAQGTPGKDGAPGQSGESFIVVSKWIMEGE